MPRLGGGVSGESLRRSVAMFTSEKVSGIKHVKTAQCHYIPWGKNSREYYAASWEALNVQKCHRVATKCKNEHRTHDMFPCCAAHAQDEKVRNHTITMVQKPTVT